MNTCTEVEHVEVRGEVVSGVSSGQMVKIGVMEKLPPIPNSIKQNLETLEATQTSKEITNRRLTNINLHVIEERCESEEDSAGHAREEEELCVDETSKETTEALPLWRLRVPLRCLLWGTKAQRDGQSISDGVDLHVDWEAIEERCPQQTLGWQETVSKFMDVHQIRHSFFIFNRTFQTEQGCEHQRCHDGLCIPSTGHSHGQWVQEPQRTHTTRSLNTHVVIYTRLFPDFFQITVS